MDIAWREECHQSGLVGRFRLPHLGHHCWLQGVRIDDQEIGRPSESFLHQIVQRRALGGNRDFHLAFLRLPASKPEF